MFRSRLAGLRALYDRRGRRKRGTVAGLMAAALCWGCGGARAAPTCVANASNIAFGSLGVGSLLGATSTGSLYEGCTGGFLTLGNMAVCNAIGAGSNSVSQTNRTMTRGAYSIAYNLYTNSGFTTPYADPGSYSFAIPYSAVTGGYTTTTTYAQILSAGAVPPGLYTDTYSTNAQSFVSFNSVLLLTPPITCGLNFLDLGLPLTFTVSVTVLASCSVSASNLSFGPVSLLTANVDAMASLAVTCTNTTPYTIALDAGQGSGATVANRLMTSAGGATVGYGLYQDPSRMIPWGVTPPPAGNADTLSGVGTGSTQTLWVYGRVWPQTTPAQGGYTDTVLVTLTY